MRVIILALLCLSQPALAQQMTGTLDGQTVDMALDCSKWDDPNPKVFAEGDRGTFTDRNGDGVGMMLHYFPDARVVAGMYVTLGDTRFNLGPAMGSPDNTTGWEFDADTAMLSGIADNEGDPVDVDLVVDCTDR